MCFFGRYIFEIPPRFTPEKLSVPLDIFGLNFQNKKKRKYLNLLYIVYVQYKIRILLKIFKFT